MRNQYGKAGEARFARAAAPPMRGRSRGNAYHLFGKKQGVSNTDKRKKYTANHRMNDIFCRTQNKPDRLYSFLPFAVIEQNHNEP